MSRQSVQGLVQALLVPLVTTLFGAAGVAFQDWRTRRSRTGRRKPALEDARAQVAFVAEWWQAVDRVDVPDRRDAARQDADARLAEASAGSHTASCLRTCTGRAACAGSSSPTS